jgi:enoyl-CoA hydratase/carnithine racemase
MSDIITERSNGILRVELNRPEKKNAMTAAMYTSLAEIINVAGKDEAVRVVLWHAAGSAFCAGNDMGDFLKNPPGPGNFPQGDAMDALIGFEKPIVAAVQGVAIGGGTTMLTHCDFVYAGESTKFQVPFVNLGLVPEFGSSYSVPGCVGHLRAAELFLLGEPFTATRAAELGLATRVVPDKDLLATATETAQKLAAKPSGALQAGKRLIKQASIGQVREAALKIEPPVFFERLRSAEAKEAFSAFLEKRPPDFSKISQATKAENVA